MIIEVFYNPDLCDWNEKNERELQRRGLKPGDCRSIVCKPKIKEEEKDSESGKRKT